MTTLTTNSSTTINRWQFLLIAARIKTLPAVIIPIFCSSILAWHNQHFLHWQLLIYVTIAAISIQILVNILNDIIDGKRGADTEQRIGPARLSQKHRQYYQYGIFWTIVFTAIAIIFGGLLIWQRGYPIALIGIISLYFTYGYTGGKWALAYRGLGEVAVFIFFGIITVNGNYYVQTLTLNSASWLLSCQLGLLTTSLILINNLRDLNEDKKTGKNTLIVYIKRRWGLALLACCLVTPFILGFFQTNNTATGLCYLCSALFSCVLWLKIWQTKPSQKYNFYLALTSLLLIIFAVIFYLSYR